MTKAQFIGVRHLRFRSRQIPVLLWRNEGGTVAGQCLLGGAERPTVDAQSVGEVLSLLEDILEALLLARGEPALE